MPVSNFDPRKSGYVSPYIKGTAFENGSKTFSTVDVNEVEFTDQKTGKTRMLLELSLHDGQLATLNTSNYNRFVAEWGDDPNEWIGRQFIATAGPKHNGAATLVLIPTPKPAPAKAAPSIEDAADVTFA